MRISMRISDLARVDAPALVILDEDDRIVSITAGFSTAKLIKGSCLLWCKESNQGTMPGIQYAWIMTRMPTSAANARLWKNT
jgi:hypothetical protein